MIYTFYSYKGGVGRSLALANIAELLYQSGLRVLLVDWDLEAPGLERYFPVDQSKVVDQPGLIDLILDYKAVMGRPVDTEEQEDNLSLPIPEAHTVDMYPPTAGTGRLRLLSAGRRSPEHFAAYAEAVMAFNWNDFYRNWQGELFFEWMRDQFELMADVVLIDSRTGVTEMGGVCTYQLADVIVMLCAPNQQNLAGTSQMAANFSRPEVYNLRRERPLDIIVVPARVEDRSEQILFNQFGAQFTTTFDFRIPERIKEELETFWKLKIPYVPYYAYNEVVATRERGSFSEALIKAYVLLVRTIVRLAPADHLLRALDNLAFDISNRGPLPEVIEALQLHSQEEPLERALLSFGADNTVGDVTIGDVAAGNIFKISYHYDFNITSGQIDEDSITLALQHLAQLSLQQARAPLPYGSRMLLHPNPLFIGRATELVQVAELLAKGSDVAIYGIGGIGKSQLASELVHRYGRFFAGGIFWLNCSDSAAMPNEIAACGGASAMNLRPDFAILSQEVQCEAVRAAWQSPLPRLLIFDGCEEDEILYRWRPTSGGCRVLVTSRRVDWSLTFGLELLRLDPFSRTESIQLLRRYRPDLAADKQLDELSAELGDLPLALHLVGCFLEVYRSDPSLSKPAILLQELREQSLIGHKVLQGDDAWPSPTNHNLNLRQAFAMSFASLNNEDPIDALAMLLVTRAAQLTFGESITREQVLEIISSENSAATRLTVKAFRRLERLGLLITNPDNSVTVPRLVTAFLRTNTTIFLN